jgi:hypothetical protein
MSEIDQASARLITAAAAQRADCEGSGALPCCQPTTRQARGLDRGQCLTDMQGGRTPEPLLLRSAYQTLPISVARIQLVPGGAIGTVWPPICIVAFTENQTVALPGPAGLAAVIRSDEILNLNLEPCKNPATQVRCDGTTVRSTAWPELPDSAVQNARTARLAALACAADRVPETGGGDAWPRPLPELEMLLWLNSLALMTSLAGGAETCTGTPKS